MNIINCYNTRLVRVNSIAIFRLLANFSLLLAAIMKNLLAKIIARLKD